MSRVAIVTGASQGIGRATAARLARGFGAVATVARTADALAATADGYERTVPSPRSSSEICASRRLVRRSHGPRSTGLAASTLWRALRAPCRSATRSSQPTSNGTLAWH